MCQRLVQREAPDHFHCRAGTAAKLRARLTVIAERESMGSLRISLASSLLLLVSLLSGVAGGETLVWSPLNGGGLRSAMDEPANWRASSGLRATVIPPDAVLRFSGASGDGFLAKDLTCGQVEIQGASFIGTLFLGDPTTLTPRTLTISTTTFIADAPWDFVSDPAKTTGGQLRLAGGLQHNFSSFSAATGFKNTAFGTITLVDRSTSLRVPSGACPGVVATGTDQPLFGVDCVIRSVAAQGSGNIGLAPNAARFQGGAPQFGIMTIDSADLTPGPQASSTGAFFLALRGFGQAGADFTRVAVANQLTLDPSRASLFLDLTELASGRSGTAIGVVTFGTLLGGLPLDLRVTDNGGFVSADTRKPAPESSWFEGSNTRPRSTNLRKLGDRVTARSAPAGLFDVTLIETATGIDVQVVPVERVVIPVATFDAPNFGRLLEGDAVTATVRLSTPTTVPVTVQLVRGVQSGVTLITGDSLTVAETGDDLTVSATDLVFQPGQTFKTVTITALADGFVGANAELDETLILEISPASQGVTLGLTTQFSAAIVGQDRQIDFVVGNATNSSNFGLGAVVRTASAGQTIAVRVFDGVPPYRVVTADNVRFVPDDVRIEPVNFIFENGDLDPAQFFLVSVVSPLAGARFAVTDALGDTVTPIDIAAAGSEGPSQEAIIQPALPTVGDLTLYTAVCPGTEEGLAQLKAFLVGKDATQVKAFAWDASVQAYVQLPQEPVGGLTPAHAVFIATRDPVTFNFSGTQSPLPFSLLLRPGFNFVGVPPLFDGEVTRTSHAFVNDFRLTRLGGEGLTTQAEVDAVLGTGAGGANTAFLWNGVAYGEVTTISSGQGVWIKNNTADSIVLIRDFIGQVLTKGGTAASVRKLGDPPPPPTNAAARATSGSGGCGHGGGFAALVLALAFFALRRWRLH